MDDLASLNTRGCGIFATLCILCLEDGSPVLAELEYFSRENLNAADTVNPRALVAAVSFAGRMLHRELKKCQFGQKKRTVARLFIDFNENCL